MVDTHADRETEKSIVRLCNSCFDIKAWTVASITVSHVSFSFLPSSSPFEDELFFLKKKPTGDSSVSTAIFLRYRGKSTLSKLSSL